MLIFQTRAHLSLYFHADELTIGTSEDKCRKSRPWTCWLLSTFQLQTQHLYRAHHDRENQTTIHTAQHSGMPCEDTYTLQQNIWLMMQGSTEPLSLLGHCQVLSEECLQGATPWWNITKCCLYREKKVSFHYFLSQGIDVHRVSFLSKNKLKYYYSYYYSSSYYSSKRL